MSITNKQLHEILSRFGEGVSSELEAGGSLTVVINGKGMSIDESGKAELIGSAFFGARHYGQK